MHGLNFGRCLVSVIGRLIANFSCNVSLDSQTTGNNYILETKFVEETF